MPSNATPESSRRTFILLLSAILVVAALPAASSLGTSSTPAVAVTRIGAADQYATSVALSRAYFSAPSDVVVVASGENFVDGLAGGPLAAGAGAPVLLVRQSSIPAIVADELARLTPRRIVVLGGTGSVSGNVATALAAHGADVQRIAGPDQYRTSAAISASTFAPGVAAAYVATGANFPDALAAAAVAGERHQPVLLVTHGSIPTAVTKELRRLHPGKIVIVGGTNVVSKRVAHALRRISDSVTRVSGPDRYTTAARLSARSFPPDRGGSVFVASGATFADAMAAVPVAAAVHAPLLLTQPGALPDASRLELERLQPEQIMVVGGPASVSDGVVAELEAVSQRWSHARTTSPTPTATPAGTPTPTPTSLATPQATASPTETPTPDLATPTPHATSSVAPTPSPDPTPAPSRSACPGPVKGHGAGTVGGNAAPVETVTSLDALRSAVAESGPRNLRLSGSGTWNLAGLDLHIKNPNITIDGADSAIVFRGGAIKITTSQVIICNLRSRVGDDYGVGADLDAITVNGIRTPVSNVVLSHVEALWAPDVSLTALGSVSNLTVQYSIFGEGLLRSAHPESTDDLDGHSLAGNFAGGNSNGITIYGSLITSSQSREPRTIATNGFDLIDSVIYNYDEGPQGNPVCANLIGNTFKWGPAPAAAGLGSPTRLLFRYQPGAEDDSLNTEAVYVAGNATIGFTPEAASGNDAAQRRSTPCGSPASSIGASAAYQMVLDVAGVRTVTDAQTRRLIANVANGTGLYYNGSGYPGPNPTWP